MGEIPIDSIMDHIRTFSKESRPPGSHAAHVMRGTLEVMLKDLGYRVDVQKDHVVDWKLLDNPSVSVIAPEIESFKALPAILSLPTPKDGVCGEAVAAEPIKILDSFFWPRIAVLDENRNVSAFITSSDKEVRVQPLPELVEKIPHVITSFESYSRLLEIINKKEKLYVRVKNHTALEGFCDIVNILAAKADCDKCMLICAHYDSTFNSPGALDNASGVAVALYIADVAAQNGWPCEFIFFDGEEINKAGSYSYVKSRSKLQLEKITYVIEIDTVGAGRDVVFLHSKKLSKRLCNFRPPEDVTGHFNVRMSPQSKISFSDVWPFMQQGIPAIRMLTRTPPDSGQGHDVIHSEDDTIDKVDPNTIDASCSILESLIRFLL